MNKINIKLFALLTGISMLIATSAFSVSPAADDISEIQHISHCIAPLLEEGEFWHPINDRFCSDIVSALIPLPRANRVTIITLMVQIAGFSKNKLENYESKQLIHNLSQVSPDKYAAILQDIEAFKPKAEKFNSVSALANTIISQYSSLTTSTTSDKKTSSIFASAKLEETPESEHPRPTDRTDETLPLREDCLNRMRAGKSEELPIFPSDIVDELKLSILGQDDGLRAVARSICMHFSRLRLGIMQKSNLLLIGPTGSGKTATVSLIKKMLNIPVYIIDGSALTPEGYKGTNTTDLFESLLAQANENIAVAQRSIVIIDELDKIFHQREDMSTSVQNNLLKTIEGKIITIKKNLLAAPIPFDTSDILWIGMGVFEQLETHEGTVTQQALVDYGLPAELCGRFTNTCVFNTVTKENLEGILRESRISALEQAKQLLLESYKITLEVGESIYEKIATHAVKHGRGARSLHSIVDHLIAPIIDKADEYYETTYALSDEKVDSQLKLMPVSKKGKCPSYIN